MARLAAKAHFDRAHFDLETLARLNSAMLVGVIGSGLIACAIGALIFDLGRLFAALGSG